MSWRVSMEINNILETEDREVFMTLSQTYQEWKEATKREGRQEGKLEGKLESIPRLLALGLSVEQIAQALDLDLEQVRRAIQETP
ncbi:Rpn family recombination-promoting nuclease/putative transposase [Microcystis aeruginosa CS-1036]|nr:Rpn family recombination-promoting nuclease/putative transposase [Microcystis aeruginosa]MDB9545043.1 Rpn family recombination-promoting nuclease/putative transposase [Microcystis aeruginosa CS-1036]WOB70737.1 Rpn family recombination-promoting nuclease/putative transposase [Microcystis aeruginosa LE3]